MDKLMQHEIVKDANGQLRFWPSLFMYWLRFAPFWIGIAVGAAAMFAATR